MAKRKSTNPKPGRMTENALAPIAEARREALLATKPEWADGLQVDDWRFCEEYVKDCNAGAAAKRMKPWLSKESAYVEGDKRLKSPQCRSAISNYLRTQGLDDLKVRLMDFYAAIAFKDPGDYYSLDDKGNLKVTDPALLTPAQRRGISEIIQTKGKTSSMGIKFVDPLVAAREIGRAIGWTKADPASAPAVAVQINFNAEERAAI